MINKAKGNRIRKYFLANHETVSIAESVTSGLLQLAFSTIADAESFFQGGITTYNIGQKYKHLQVEPIHAKSCNCVSALIAEQMAVHVCELFSSDWGIGITGYATPVRDSGNKLFCYYAICHKGRIISADKIDGKKQPPLKVQETYADSVIEKFVECLGK